jgi:asparagine synthase (glutamine-hydrolysing)
MCGIAGIATFGGTGLKPERVQRMISAINHRGPDGAGTWISHDSAIALGHRRLAIIDLTEQGNQPMASASNRYVISYNGEVYNFAEIRKELENSELAPSWRGHSDTEVILAAFDAWGVISTLSRMVGMFAIALWDKQTRTITLARDRIGEKPLYYGILGGSLYFASELKAIRAGVDVGLQIDRDALAQFMRFGYVPAPQSIYKGIQKLLPGHFINVSNISTMPKPVAYWQPGSGTGQRNREYLATRSDEELINDLHDQLREAVGLQMVSDVPLGAFLSGGVDSSAIVALMQAQSTRRIRTFTVGFDDKAFNEAPFARAVALHLGTEHTELFITANDALELIPALPRIYDEPFADSSQIPTTLISQLTREHVTVALSGDGGDELFAGYPRYEHTAALWRKAKLQPMVLRHGVAKTANSLSAGAWNQLFGFLPGSARAGLSGSRMYLIAKLLPCTSLSEMYIRLMTRWQPEDQLVIGATRSCLPFPGWASDVSDVDGMRLWDLQNYLPDDLLVKVDRAAMSASLETRAPMLDHRVVELAMSLPERVLIRGGVGKWVLRRVLDRYVPRALIDRPKAGFEVPLSDWLRGPLRPWAQALLDPSRLKREGYLDADKVTQMWKQHLSGRWDRSIYLWNVMMFEAWLEAENMQ